jgi:hypothetical protein
VCFIFITLHESNYRESTSKIKFTECPFQGTETYDKDEDIVPEQPFRQ